MQEKRRNASGSREDGKIGSTIPWHRPWEVREAPATRGRGQDDWATPACALDTHRGSAPAVVGAARPHSARRYTSETTQDFRTKDGAVRSTDRCRSIARSRSSWWPARRVHALAAPSSPIAPPLLSKRDASQLPILLSLSNLKIVPDASVRCPVETVEDPVPWGSWERAFQRSKTRRSNTREERRFTLNSFASGLHRRAVQEREGRDVRIYDATTQRHAGGTLPSRPWHTRNQERGERVSKERV